MDSPWFNYCGLYSGDDLELIVNDIRRPIGPTITENVQEIPGMIGNLFQGNSYSSKQIEIDITISAGSTQELIQKYHDLAELFMQTGDNELPMIFYDEPDYTYYGHFVNLPAPARPYSMLAQVTLTFTCSDPKAYGEQVEQQLTANPTTVTPNGTSECYPILTCVPKKDVTKISVVDQEGNYSFIGSSVDPDTGENPAENEPLVWHDPCNTMATWTVLTKETLPFTIENGVIGGTMHSTPNTIRPKPDSDGHQDFGASTHGKWHGPCIMQYFPGSYSDWKIRVRLLNQQFRPRAQGKNELYLLDANGVRIGKFMLKDNATQSEQVFAEVQIGTASDHHNIYYGTGHVKKGKKKKLTIKVKNGTKTVTVKGKKKTEQIWKTIHTFEDTTTDAFTNFYGYLQLEKIGNKYTATLMKLDDGSNPGWSKPITTTWTDTGGKYSKNKLGGAAYYAAKWDISEDDANPKQYYRNNDLFLTDLLVWNIINGGNPAGATQVVARGGDEIKINSEDHSIYKNGDFFMKYLSVGSDFLTMKGGIPKTLAFEPGLDEADWYIAYRPTRG